MRYRSSRLAAAGAALLVSVSAARAQSENPPAAPSPPAAVPSTENPAAAPAPAPAPASTEPQDSAEAKLAVVLRSYSLLQAENEQLKAEQEKLTAEKASLEAQLGVAKNAIPLADQAAGLREQLRQTQDQLASIAAENRELKTKLALGTGSQSSLLSSPTHPGSAAATAARTPAPATGVRTHVIAEGDTLTKISQKYYDTPNRWPEILSANRDVMRDEKSLVVGRKLKIP